jgi:hypothetical protein
MGETKWQFSLSSLLWSMACLGLIACASRYAVFWLLMAFVNFMVTIGSPFLLFFGFVYWLNRNRRNG